MKGNRGYALVFTLGIIALLSAVAAMLAGPAAVERKRVDLHYRNVQAQYLSLAGIEQSKTWATRGVLTNELYLLANGTVDTTMQRDGNRCRITSVGRVRTDW